MSAPSFFQRFHRRASLEEAMDRPDCDESRLFRTLDQFKAINLLFSRARGLLKQTILRDMRPGRSYHLVDLGAGACDLPVWLLNEAQKRGLTLTVTAVDADPRAVRYAREKYDTVEGLVIRHGDALDLERLQPFDYVFANHFLHHLPDGRVAEVLARAQRFAGRGFVFSDLKRSPWSYLGFSVFARIYTKSFSREDGLISIRKGFRPEDFDGLKASVPLRIRTPLPGRIQILGGEFAPQNGSVPVTVDRL